jgi:hypothetical protein
MMRSAASNVGKQATTMLALAHDLPLAVFPMNPC